MSVTQKSESIMPVDLRKILVANPKANARWEDLTPIARRDFMSWIDSAKQPETRKRRVESLPSRLASGKRRPCCYAIVPMNMYRALDSLPKAKAAWKNLTSDERRDFTDWINAGKDSGMRAGRIEKSCAALLSGKRRP